MRAGQQEIRVGSHTATGADCSDVGRGSPLVVQPSVWCDEPARTERETAATGTQRPRVDGVVADRVEERRHCCLCARVVPGDGKRAAVCRAGRTGKRAEVPESDVVKDLDHMRGTEVSLEHLAGRELAVEQLRYRPVALWDEVDRVEDRLAGKGFRRYCRVGTRWDAHHYQVTRGRRLRSR